MVTETDRKAIARLVWRELSKTAMRSLATEKASERFDYWDGWRKVVDASDGYLRITRWGIIEAIPAGARHASALVAAKGA